MHFTYIVQALSRIKQQANDKRGHKGCLIMIFSAWQRGLMLGQSAEKLHPTKTPWCKWEGKREFVTSTVTHFRLVRFVLTALLSIFASKNDVFLLDSIEHRLRVKIQCHRIQLCKVDMRNCAFSGSKRSYKSPISLPLKLILVNFHHFTKHHCNNAPALSHNIRQIWEF